MSEATIAATTSEDAKGKLLLVDDNPSNLQVLYQTLNGLGHEMRVAKSGEDALRISGTAHPDLILLDIMMPPGIDGYETCRQLKANPETQEIAVIFMSALDETESKIKGFDLGAVDYITKPFEPSEVIARVNTHLTIQRLKKSLAAKNAELDKANQFIRQTFGRYVSEEVVDTLFQSPEGLDLGGEEREVTILMSDLRGFTATVERLDPQKAIGFLNRYLEKMVEVISRYAGTIVEIIGDAIMVIFGAPMPMDDHAQRGVACGLVMQMTMFEVNLDLQQEGVSDLEMGIGLHTGKVIVGNIGSTKRTKYGAVGSHVNLAGRIESYTTGGQVLISEATRQHITSELRIDGQLEIRPKGAAENLQLHEIGGIGAPYNLYLPGVVQPFTELATPIPFEYSLLEEKAVAQTAAAGAIVQLSLREAVLSLQTTPVVLSNLHLRVKDPEGNLLPGDLYAKVVEDIQDRPELCRVRFTSVPPDIKKRFASLCG